MAQEIHICPVMCEAGVGSQAVVCADCCTKKSENYKQRVKRVYHHVWVCPGVFILVVFIKLINLSLAIKEISSLRIMCFTSTSLRFKVGALMFDCL